VVLLKVEEKDKSSGVSVKTRERVVVKHLEYEVEDSLNGCIDHAKLDSVLQLVKTALKSLKSGNSVHDQHCHQIHHSILSTCTCIFLYLLVLPDIQLL